VFATVRRDADAERLDPLIPLDEVIDAAKAVAERMPREHRCTSLGGMAETPTSLRIERRLAAARGAVGAWGAVAGHGPRPACAP